MGLLLKDIVLDTYRITLLSNSYVRRLSVNPVLDTYRITLLSNSGYRMGRIFCVLDTYRITLLSNPNNVDAKSIFSPLHAM